MACVGVLGGFGASFKIKLPKFKKNKMNKLFKIALLSLVGIMLTSCAGSMTLAGVGAVYTGSKEPLAITSNTLGSKVGSGYVKSYLGIAAVGDASISKIAKEAGITQISHVDVKRFSILGIYSRTTLYVYGK